VFGIAAGRRLGHSRGMAIEIAVLIYDGLTALDAVGPMQVLSALPGARVKWVAAEPGPKRSDASVALVADHALDAVPRPDIVVVPGAMDVRPAAGDPRVLEWLVTAHRTTTWTTSVCTGALILGAAGILRGLQATTHWGAMDALATFGATPIHERVVRDGRVVTAAGVSAGIDMALRLAALVAGEPVAQTIQLMIEYDPDPPYRAGSPTTAPAEVVARARRVLARPVAPST
jgi:transcriptional regulator GlxA family with amidase domain